MTTKRPARKYAYRNQAQGTRQLHRNRRQDRLDTMGVVSVYVQTGRVLNQEGLLGDNLDLLGLLFRLW